LAKTIGVAVLGAAFLCTPLALRTAKADSPASAPDSPAPAAAGVGKVTICHKGHVQITVSRNALDAHLAHGDTISPCVITTVN